MCELGLLSAIDWLAIHWKSIVHHSRARCTLNEYVSLCNDIVTNTCLLYTT